MEEVGWRRVTRGGAAAFGGPGAFRPPGRQTKERGRGLWPRAPLFQGAQRPAAAPLDPWGVLPSLRTKRPFFRTNFLQTKQARRSR